MKVSVLMATYNRVSAMVNGQSLLERAIKSFLNQDYAFSNLIILNNGSKDNTRIILNKYSDHPGIIIHHVKDNMLPPQNLNYLWDKADGDLICQLHDDDELTKDSLSLRVKQFKENPQLEVVYGGVITQNIDVTDCQNIAGEPPDTSRILNDEYINFTTMMYRRNLPFRFDASLIFYCDWLFKIRCLKECNVSYVVAPVMRYTVHHGQESNRCKAIGQNIAEESLMRVRLKELYG